ncbi:DUF4124 domain-containing protein [Neisseria sp. S1]|uniref:DUF4124 domain-containing protein n=1 Tax=Neisseria sp. S1 TaxID=3318354 RepID=UPI003A8BA6DB
MQLIKTAKILALGVLFASSSLYASEVFSWKNANGSTSYSDVPRNLKPSHASRLNVRTQTVTPPPAAPAAQPASGESLAEQQQQLSNQVAQHNRQIEEQNKKIEEENRQQREANCKTARMNRQFAESARSNNRDQLIQRYDADISKFCN